MLDMEPELILKKSCDACTRSKGAQAANRVKDVQEGMLLVSSGKTLSKYITPENIEPKVKKVGDKDLQ
eukprot:maker-scaffold_6-snap-gene-17.23-mRNA-1 protein AED:0.02 eAED:0.02 QI:199/0.5/0.8/1/1/0.8/5/1131/67